MAEMVENVAESEVLGTLKVGEQYASQAKLLQGINCLYYSPSERKTGIYGLDGNFHQFPTQMEVENMLTNEKALPVVQEAIERGLTEIQIAPVAPLGILLRETANVVTNIHNTSGLKSTDGSTQDLNTTEAIWTSSSFEEVDTKMKFYPDEVNDQDQILGGYSISEYTKRFGVWQVSLISPEMDITMAGKSPKNFLKELRNGQHGSSFKGFILHQELIHIAQTALSKGVILEDCYGSGTGKGNWCVESPLSTEGLFPLVYWDRGVHQFRLDANYPRGVGALYGLRVAVNLNLLNFES